MRNTQDRIMATGHTARTHLEDAIQRDPAISKKKKTFKPRLILSLLTLPPYHQLRLCPPKN